MLHPLSSEAPLQAFSLTPHPQPPPCCKPHIADAVCYQTQTDVHPISYAVTRCHAYMSSPHPSTFPIPRVGGKSKGEQGERERPGVGVAASKRGLSSLTRRRAAPAHLAPCEGPLARLADLGRQVSLVDAAWHRGGGGGGRPLAASAARRCKTLCGAQHQSALWRAVALGAPRRRSAAAAGRLGL